MKKIYSFLILMLFAVCCTTFFACSEININSADVSFIVGFNKTSLEYNGENQMPLIAYAKVNGEVISSKHYEISAPNCKNVGKYTAKIKLKNGYSGIYYKEFSIVPKKISLNEDKIFFRTKTYEEGNRVVLFSDSTEFELLGVIGNDDVKLKDTTNAYARIKTTNVDAGLRDVEYVGFELEGNDIANYELVTPISSINIARASQSTPVLDQDFSVNVYRNKVVVNKLCSEELEYKLETNNTTSTYAKTTVFTGLLEDTSYSLYVRKPSSTNYSTSSYTYVVLKTNTIDISLDNIEATDEIIFESGDANIERQENGLTWQISGVLPMASEAQKNYFNNSNYDYFLPINLQIKNNLDNAKVDSIPKSVSFVISDGVANVERNITFNEDEEPVLQLIKGISKSMLENGSFSITITWGTSESETYVFDISNLEEPVEVRSTSVRKNISTFDSSNIQITQENENIKEYTVGGNFARLTANQSSDLSANYNYFVAIRFENTTVDFADAKIQFFDYIDGSYSAVFDEPIDLVDFKANSQFSVEVIKGLKLNQTSFKILIIWNSENSVEYVFNISSDSVFESIKNVDSSNALLLAGCQDEFYNNSTIRISKTGEASYSVTGSANYLTDSQLSVYDTTNRNFIILFFESDDVASAQVKLNNGEYVSVAERFKNENGFYQILEVNSLIQSLNLLIKWNENKTENYTFDLSGISY